MTKRVYLSGLLVFCFILCSVAVRAAVPVITTDPHDTTACFGHVASFSIVASGTPTSFTWQVSEDGTTWTNVTAGGFYTIVPDTLKIGADTSLSGNMYRCIAINATGKDTSAPATLMVDTVVNPGVITGSDSICVGSSITLADVVTGGVWSFGHNLVDTTDPTGVVTARAQGFDTIKYSFTNSCGVFAASQPIRVDTPVIPLPITGPTVTCVGHNINMMNENTLGNHTWEVSNGNASINAESGILTGVAGGNVVVSYSFSNACISGILSTVSVLVDTVLEPGTISGSTDHFCDGSWITLSATATGGAWISSNSSIANVDGSGNVTGVAQGTATISYFRSNGCGVSTATYVVTVENPAGPITGTDSVGVGATRALGNSTPGGIWSSSNHTVDTVNASGVVYGVAVGANTITYEVNNSCGITVSTVAMYVNHAPGAGTITGPDSVCVGTTITLSNSTAPGGIWTSKWDSIATVDPLTGIVTPVDTAYGIDTIFYKYTNGFGSTTIKKSIFVNRPPNIIISGPGSVALGGSYTLVGYPAGGTWSASSDTSSSLIGYGFFVVVHSGTTVFTYTAHNTCGTTSKTFTVTLAAIPPVIVNQVAAQGTSLNVYPNPNQGTFTMNLSSDVKESATATISNIVGAKVKEFTVNTNEKASVNMDMPAGVYILSVTTASGNTYSAKISVAK